MSDTVGRLVLDGLAAFVSIGTDSAGKGIATADLLRDDLAVDSLKLLMVISHVSEQMDLELSDFIDVDFHGMETVADLIDAFDKVVRESTS